MIDSRLQKLARLMVQYSTKVKKGEYVFIQGNSVSEPLLKEIYREVVRAGAYPEVSVSIDGAREILLKEGSDDQLQFILPTRRTMSEKCDVLIHLWGEANTKSLTNVDSKRISLQRRAMREIVQIQHEREERGEFRWCGTQFPTHADAQEAGMSLEEYENFVYGAGLLDKEDPVSEWNEISKRQQKIIEYLNTKKELHIVSKDTDLKMRIDGRAWINCDGHVNFPDGEVFTTPVEDSVEGYIRFSFPGIYAGKEIEDIRLEFKEGRVVKASAAKGEDLLLALLDTDEGAKRLGEIAIGTNYNITKFTRNMLFDEKIGGTVHAALGESIPGTNGNNHSGIHWDMLCDMKDSGKIYADGELFYENGKFLDVAGISL